MLFLPDRMEGLRCGHADTYEKIDMPAEDFASLAEKLMGGSLNETEA